MGNRQQNIGALKVWDGGDMVIELAQSQIGFVVGSSISGVVHIRQNRIFNAKNLTLSLTGTEHSFIRKRHTRTHYGSGG